MKNLLKSILPVLIIILAEITVAIFLFIDPIGFTTWVVRILGIAMLCASLFYIVRFIILKIKKEDTSVVPLIISVIVLAAGIICTFFAPQLLNVLTKATALVFGIAMIISGIIKINMYIDTKREGFAVSVISLLSSIFSLLFGIVLIILSFAVPETVANAYLYVAAVGLLLEAAFDLVALVFALRLRKKIG